MNKSELVEKVAKETKQSRRSVAKALTTAINILQQTATLEDVSISGFGTFYTLRHRRTPVVNRTHGQEFSVLKFRQSRRSRNGKTRSSPR